MKLPSLRCTTLGTAVSGRRARGPPGKRGGLLRLKVADEPGQWHYLDTLCLRSSCSLIVSLA